MIDPIVVPILLLLLGDGERGKVSPERGGRPIPGPQRVVRPREGLWPRTAPSGGRKSPKMTGTTNVIEWRKSRYQAALDALQTDTSLDVMARATEGDVAIDVGRIALAMLTHWDIETASGASEYLYNVGGIHAIPGQQYAEMAEAASGTPTAWVAYDSLAQAIADYLGVLSYERYSRALDALMTHPESSEWFRLLGESGYYGMEPAKAERAYQDRRAALVRDLGVPS